MHLDQPKIINANTNTCADSLIFMITIHSAGFFSFTLAELLLFKIDP